jgi:hypothetical protein
VRRFKLAPPGRVAADVVGAGTITMDAIATGTAGKAPNPLASLAP